MSSDIYYRVTKISDLEKVVRHFDQYPLKTKKAKNYQLWREMVFLKENFGKPYKQLDDLVKNFQKKIGRLIENLSSTLSRFNLDIFIFIVKGQPPLTLFYFLIYENGV